MLDLSAIRSGEPNSRPFAWTRVDRCFASAEAAAELEASFPADDFWTVQAKTADRSWSYAARPLVILGRGEPAPLPPLPSRWQELVDDLLSPDYRDALEELTGLDLSDALMEASAWRWDAAAHLSPHRDLPDKLLTQVFYLEPEWEPDWGGCLRILGSNDEQDCVEEIPPILGTASVLVRGPSSWHSVTAVQGGARRPRRSVIVTWQVPGSSSPVWALNRRGRVVCTAGGLREDAGSLQHASRRIRGAVRRLAPSS